MDDSTNEAWSWGVELDTFEGRPTLSTGVYDCLSCIKEFGSSPEFPITGRMEPKDICSCHPQNGPEDFRLTAPLKMPSGTRITTRQDTVLGDVLGIKLSNPGGKDQNN